MTWLYVLVVILVLFVVILFSPVCLEGAYSKERIYLLAKWLFIKYDIYPPDKKKQEKKKIKAAKKEKKKELKEAKAVRRGKIPKEKKKKHLFGDMKPIEFLKLFASVISQMGKTARTILRRTTFKNFSLEVTVGGEDAAKAALTYGEICAFTYPALGLLHANSKMKNPKVNIFADYEKEETDVNFSSVAKIPLIMLVISVLWIVPSLIKNIR